MVLAVAASVLIVVGLATWALLRPHGQQTARAVIDLRDRSMARGNEPPPSETPLEIPKNVAALDIYLPLGSGEGSYDVRVISANGESLLSATGEAKLDHGLTILNIDVGPRLSRPGNYIFQVRRQQSEWGSFALHVR
ncbi:MAG TPA: hypothetical protein VGR97_02685 [Candidatus Acidoferrales bacterium]|nr:hypothetical protein [Candidatus Acidoferrales bacterium]